MKGFIDSLNDHRYDAAHLEDATIYSFVDWWKMDISKISDYYTGDAGGGSDGWDIFEVYISKPNEGFVTLYLCKSAVCGSMLE